jgi:geranylgeranyl diphosphate synthase, type II
LSAEIDLLSAKFGDEFKVIDAHLKLVMQQWAPLPSEPLKKLWESVQYSVFSSGKRFRPLLSLLTAKALNVPAQKVLPLASAVEFIHTYSLIHDDLPVMDNDDLRRGRPTNHKVYGEPLALLAGDGLLTLAFFVLARGLSGDPHAALVIEKVARAAGIEGMVGGQALDIATQEFDEQILDDIHRMKTGALIQVSVDGAAILGEATLKQSQALTEYGRCLGLAFQLADDMQDAGEKIENVNFVHQLGPEQTIQSLKKETDDGLKHLEIFGDEADGLRFLLTMNLKRISL